MRSKSNRKKTVIALTAGFLAAFGIFTSFSQKDAQVQRLVNETQLLKTQMGRLSQNNNFGMNSITGNIAVLAKQNINAGTVLKAEMMEAKQLRPELIPAGSSSNLYSLIGKINTKEIKSGDFIKNTDIIENSFNELDLPDGMRAVSIPVSYIQGLASFMKKGSSVDIISTAKTATEKPELILQNVKLISIEGQASTSSDITKATALTFQIPASSSARLVNAMMSGKLLIVARNFTDKKIVFSKNNERKHFSSSSSLKISPVSTSFKLPELPTLTKITPQGLPQPAEPSVVSTKKVELIQANVKSEVNFNSDY